MLPRLINYVIILVVGILNVYPQSTDQNYIMTRTMTNVSGSTYLDNIQYFDGLGRSVQIVQRGMTPDKTGDWVSLQTYDGFGREDESWLPGVIKSNNGKYNASSVVQTASKASNLNDAAPYAKPVYETSPLNRVLEQYGPGATWYTNKKAVQIGYLTNNTKATLSLVLVDSLVCGQLVCTAPLTYSYTKNYDAGQLYVTRMTDEDGNRGYEFKDKLGQVVLTRQISDNLLHDTYYVYDDYGNQTAVFPPEASQLIYNNKAQLNDKSDAREKYAYLYKYDNYNRLVKKKLPGAEWIYYLYDKADRLIFSQDGEQRKRSEWSFSIPDVFGREVLVGICKNNLDYTSDPLKNIIVKATYNTGRTNLANSYTVTGVSLITPSILLANYYDNYSFLGISEVPNNTNTQYLAEADYGICYGDHQEANRSKNKGLLTGTLTAQLLADGIVSKVYLYSIMYYDNKGRTVQVKSNNHVDGGIEKEYIAYDFIGQPLKRKLVHTNPKAGTAATTEVYTHTYDHAGRLLNTYHQLNSGSNTLIASNTYDDLGRLKTDKKGNQANLITTYTYDIRSRARSMNSYHLGFTLEYTYGSNISKQSWVQEGVSRSYAFTYDGLSRLKKATFSGGKAGEKFTTGYSYDKHGNIKTMTREGKKGTTYALVDNLTFTHNGNQLTNIKDAIKETAKPEGETDFYSQAGDNGLITYNANGAMASDTHKGIGSMTYNALNLPASITVNSHALTSGNVKYLYSASGSKVQSIHTENTNLRSMALMGTATYTTGNPSVTTTDYIGNKVYENNKLKRILIPGGYIENNSYFYYLTDHLGNNRAVATATAGIVQRTQYYPFGLPFADAQARDLQPYTYNGKENDSRLQLNLMDYEARQNNNQYGSFMSMDPLAEKYYSWSPYTYVGNNPLKLTDPTGMYWEDNMSALFAYGLSMAMSQHAEFLQKDTEKIAKDYFQAYKNGDLKKAGELFTKGMKVRNSITDLENGIAELKEMGDAKDQSFSFKKISGDVGGTGQVTNKTNNTVIEMQINGGGSMVNGVHESAHGYDIWKGGPNTKDNWDTREIKAYGRQYSYDPQSMPTSYWGSIKTRNDITSGWVSGIYIMKGEIKDYIYAKYILQGSKNKYSSSAIESMLDIRRKNGNP